MLIRGSKIILLGDYGTGKSRCVQETFFILNDISLKNWLFPIAIDLRENWGVRRGNELLRRHFDDIGMSRIGESTIRLIKSKRLILLIDGFDEIASQTWSNDPVVLRNIRRQSLSAVSDLMTKINCGVLITGRDHYFNSPDEMFECLNLKNKNTYVLSCAQEFSEPEFLEYLSSIHGLVTIPEWLPKKPLICQVLSNLEKKTLDNLLSDNSGEIQFWSSAIDAICEREASINSILDASVIKDVLIGLAKLTRSKNKNFGPLSTREINDVFTKVTGAPPSDETAIILQRLPLLGRVESQSSDRQFVETYFLDGLRSEDICREVFMQNDVILSETWFNPLRPFGVRILSNEISESVDMTGFIRFLRGACSGTNKILSGDIVCGILGANNGTFNFDGLNLSETHIFCLDLTRSTISNIEISDSLIDELIISEAHPKNINIKNCTIAKVDGVSESSGLPIWMNNNEVGEYVRVNTVTRIKQANLSTEQKVFVTIIKKTFFQPGSGRKEQALLRGLGSPQLKRSSDKILKMLIREGILITTKGKEGTLYVPQRSHAHRMSEILKELTLSEDELWKKLNPND